MGLLDRKKLEAAQESTAGEYTQFVPGVYMCQVQAVRTKWTNAKGETIKHTDKECVKFILDVAEGDNAGKFSDDYWSGEDKDWGHTLWVSWKETALGMLKHTFHAFDDANAGFDSEAAFDVEKWELFIGKTVRVVWNGDEYTKNNGETALRVRPARAVLEAENAKARVKLEDGRSVIYEDYAANSASNLRADSSTAYETSDVPF